MAAKYYLKEIVNNPIYDPKGKAIPFEPLAEGYGVIVLNEGIPQEDEWITVLEACVKKHIGGVVPIDQTTYAKKKKSLPYMPPSEKEQLRVFQTSHPAAKVEAPKFQRDPASSVAGAGDAAQFTMGGPKTALPTAADLAPTPQPANFSPKTGRGGQRPRALTKSAEKALAAAGA